MVRIEQRVKIPEGMTQKEIEEYIKKTIFRPVENDNHIHVDKYFKEVRYILDNKRKQLEDTKKEISMLEQLADPNYGRKKKRWTFLHKKIKHPIIYSILFFLEKRMKKYLVKNIEDVPERWSNNLLRMFYNSFHKGLYDMWIYQHRAMNPYNKAKYGSPSQYLGGNLKIDFKNPPSKKNLSHWSRLQILNLLLTEACEDTIDREWFNMSILNLTHMMMEFYGVSEKERDKVPRSGENKFPVFTSGIEFHPQYFIENKDYPVWKSEIGHDPIEWVKKYDLEEKKQLEKAKQKQEQEQKKSKSDKNVPTKKSN
jgi:hypothetical protein